jgi:3-hydroxyisobutyrate dehydrogenase-like beta-hydroxyacid dehydrogenase
MVNQIAIAGRVQGLWRALHFAKSAGLDTAKVLEARLGGPGRPELAEVNR